MQKKPILYDLVALVFPRVMEQAYIRGVCDGLRTAKAKLQRDRVQQHMAALESFQAVSFSEGTKGGLYYSVYVPGPESEAAQ